MDIGRDGEHEQIPESDEGLVQVVEGLGQERGGAFGGFVGIEPGEGNAGVVQRGVMTRGLIEHGGTGNRLTQDDASVYAPTVYRSS